MNLRLIFFLSVTLLTSVSARADVQEELWRGEKATDTTPLAIEQFNYRVFGDGEKPWLVLVHGLGGSIESWGETATEFSRDHRVLVYDQRGHGKSRIDSENFSSSTMARDLRFLMDELKIREAHLVGHSMGGRTVLRFAADYPDRVRSVTVEDMHMKGRSKLQPNFIELSRAIKPLYKPTFASARDFYRLYQPHMQWNRPEHIYNFGWTDTDGKFQLYFKPHYNLLYSTQGLQENMSRALAEVKAPLLFLAASIDPVLYGEGIDHLRKTRPDVEIVKIPGADHSIHISARAEFLRQVREFMLRPPPNAPRSCRSVFGI